MGMFDTVLVDKSIINPFLKEAWIGYNDHDYEDHDNTYYYFQTKDLENALFSYYIEADKKVYLENYHYNEEKKSYEKSSKKEQLITADINFYDSFSTDTEEVWLEFKGTIVRGVLEDIKIFKCETHNLEVLKEKNKIASRWREKQEALWEMKLWRFFQNVEWKISKLYQKLFGLHYFKFKQWLKNRVDKKIGPFPNIYK